MTRQHEVNINLGNKGECPCAVSLRNDDTGGIKPHFYVNVNTPLSGSRGYSVVEFCLVVMPNADFIAVKSTHRTPRGPASGPWPTYSFITGTQFS